MFSEIDVQIDPVISFVYGVLVGAFLIAMIAIYG